MTDARRKVWIALALWAFCAALAFWAFARTEPTGDSFLRGANRVGVFLSWHLAALVPALAAFVMGRRLPMGTLRRLTWVPVGIYGVVLVGLLALILWAQVASLVFAPDAPPPQPTTQAVDP